MWQQVEAEDVGPIQKIRVGHDNSGSAPGWFLDKVLYSQRISSLLCCITIRVFLA